MLCGLLSMLTRSLSARRAWIEIVTRYRPTPKPVVALRKESVDRNLGTMQIVIIVVESLSARRAWIEIEVSESESLAEEVALRKESVDRNSTVQIVVVIVHASLSARRAWIEILHQEHRQTVLPSLSARRAWIEIDTLTDDVSTGGVALRKESVDRN